jgi:hypothetical protein
MAEYFSYHIYSGLIHQIHNKFFLPWIPASAGVTLLITDLKDFSLFSNRMRVVLKRTTLAFRFFFAVLFSQLYQ